ncbi:hypothetical protein ACFWNQ_09380 [Streptomyces virginiae]|uniref:hypothetical protein n=1 Tax=Streptomyces virginiae TaxID=1961 RepID=UPI003646AA98
MAANGRGARSRDGKQLITPGTRGAIVGYGPAMVDRFPEIASVEEFIRLRRSEDPVECDRSAWAAMPLTVWWQLVREHPEMRFWAAHNRTCPPEILAELIKDADWRVRDRVLGKRSCPPELLEQLADDPHDSVRNTVANHPHSPRTAVARLVDDPWSVIAEAARVRLANWPTQ